MKTFFSIALLTCLYVAPASAQDKGLPGADYAPLRLTGSSSVIQVIDPYTIQLADGRLARLAGLDIPDYKPHDPGDIAITSMDILRDMLEGKDVNIYQTKKKAKGRINRMGHHIAHLERKEDNAWVQGSLIALGLARVRSTKRNPEMATQMYLLEKNAREEKLGLWAIAEHGILAPENTEDKEGSFQIVEGRVESAAIRKNRIYLNFGKDWRNDFTVSIAPMGRRTFTKAGLDPLQWNNQTLRVRGWVESYNGPYIEIDHPESVEVIGQDGRPSETLQEPEQGSMVRSIDTNH